MSRSGRVASLLLVIGVVLTGSACRRNQQPAAAPPATATADTVAAADRARRDSLERVDAARRDSIARAEAAARAARDARLVEVRNTLTAAIYFDLDSDALTDAARASLDAKLPILTANPSLQIRIAGHADERGSDEYNLALGQRRAATTKRYLQQRGIAENRMEVVGFGEERPVCTERDETCWSRNRRAEFEITAGGDQLAAPAP